MSDPANPISLGVYDTPGQATVVRRVADRLYIADEAGGLQILQPVDQLRLFLPLLQR